MLIRSISRALWLSFTVFITGPASVAGRDQPRVVFVTGDHEYSSELTMPTIAKELEEKYGMRTTVLYSRPDHTGEKDIPGLEVLRTADLAVFFLRWRQLPEGQVRHIQEYLDSIKPVIGFRTSSHAFNYPKGHPLEKWNAFGEMAFGTPPGWGAAGHKHYGHTSSTDVSVNPAAADHPVLKGVARSFHVRSWLYHVLPKYPPEGATHLLIGKAVNPDKPALENPVAWTHRTKAGGRAVYTSLGHPEDFKEEAVQRLVINAVHWALGKPVPDRWAGKMDINVAYGQHRKPERENP